MKTVALNFTASRTFCVIDVSQRQDKDTLIQEDKENGIYATALTQDYVRSITLIHDPYYEDIAPGGIVLNKFELKELLETINEINSRPPYRAQYEV